MRFMVFVAGVIAGVATLFAILATGISPLSLSTGHDRAQSETVDKIERAHHDDALRHVKLTPEQISKSGITVAQAKGGVLSRHFLAPGSLIPDADHVARVSVRVVATVVELRKKLGDSVEKGEIVATIESRELADAKSEYLGARVTNELRQTLLNRQRGLVESRTVSENEFLRTQLSADEAKIRLDGSRQKLFALGLSESEIAELHTQPVESLRQQYLRAPIAGRISERRVDLGALVGREGQESELFVVVNLESLWIDLAVSPEDLVQVREGQPVSVKAIGTEDTADAKIIFVSPLLDRETRNARVIASLPNADYRWKPGTFVTAEVPFDSRPSDVIVPRKALQTIKGVRTIFVRTANGFEVRAVQVGREDDNDVEITSGIVLDEVYAVSNTFTLKAELEKSAAEHEH